MASTTNGGPAAGQTAQPPARRAAAHGPGAIRQGSLVREPERAARRCSSTRSRRSTSQSTSSANPLAGTDFEVELKLEGKAEASGTVLFSFELVFAGVFRIQNVPQENLHPMMMIECPRLLFPFAREIIATAVRNGGFPPLLLDPIDFVALYQQRMAQLQPAAPSRAARPGVATSPEALRRAPVFGRVVRPILPPDRRRRRASRRTRDARRAPRR